MEKTNVWTPESLALDKLTDNNTNHNYFNNSEVSLRKEQLRYQNSLFVFEKVFLEALVPLGTKFVTTIRHITDANKVKYDNFNEFLKVQTTTDLKRSDMYYESKLAGDTNEVANNKAQAIVIDLSNVKAMNGKNEFLAWIVAEHPDDIRKYVSNVESLNYTTMLTEDEAE